MNDGTALIEIERGAIGYGHSSLIEGIDMTIHPGDYLALVGPNGAGKSTLVKTLLGTLAPVLGSVTRRPALQVGYVPQRGSIDPIYPTTALEVVRTGTMGSSGPRSRWFAVASRRDGVAALERVGLGMVAPQSFRKLSYGQQQRVLIARALVRRPDLLVLDEPTAGMDLPSEAALLDFITSLNRDERLAVVLVVHQLSIAAGRARQVAFINHERGLFAMGASAELFTDERLTELYNTPMKATQVDGDIVIRTVREGESS